MVIGFTQSVRTVCECDVTEGEDLFPIDIEVATLRLAEREHPIVFRLQSVGTAIVEPHSDIQNLLFDALFGTREDADGLIDVEFNLENLQATIPPLPAQIRNDLRPEDEECFTIRIFPLYVPGRNELFSCNEDDSGEDNYFCEIKICIEDDDGKLWKHIIELLIK